MTAVSQAHGEGSEKERWKLKENGVLFGKVADFSRGVFRRVTATDALRQLRVVNISRTPLQSADLETLFLAAPSLLRIDASRCGLCELPDAEVCASLLQLKVALFHQNALRRWDDLLSLCRCPALIWLTIFQNPVAGDPMVRSVILEQKPSILAVDHRTVSEPERLGSEWDVVGAILSRTRFAARLLDPDSLDLEVGTHGHKRAFTFQQKEDAMLKLAAQEIRFLEECEKRSPACCIQASWRGFHGRKAAQQHKERLVQAAMTLQRGARRLLWRKEMAEYVKEYLGEIDELDLLLDAKEMLRRRALKLIEARVRRWILQRSLQRRERKAAELINRCARSCLVRRRLLYKLAGLHQCQSFYFPERHAWEFLVVCNMVLRAQGLETLPADHAFEDADVLGIRFPEFNEAPHRDSTLLRFLAFAGRVVLRPLRSGRFPEHQWDGPFHRLVDKAPPRWVSASWKKVRRRGDKYTNRCGDAFRASCCPGAHPVRREEPGEASEYVILKELLEGPEDLWPQAPFLRAFLLEARRLKPKTWHKCWQQPTAKVEAGLRNYSETAWLSQRVLRLKLPTAQAALELCYALHSFSRLAKLLPSVDAVPALYGKAVMEISLATVMQACWRAHRDRRALGCSLKLAALRRRAALCIQRSWRWNLLKRRLELLSGALRLARSIRSPVVYIEERLFLGLNAIAAVDRYPRFAECEVCFGFSAESEVPVLLGQRPERTRRSVASSKTYRARQGLPQWFVRETQLQLARPDTELRPLRGLQGLLLEGLGAGCEDKMIDVPSPFLESFARACAAGGMEKELEEMGVTKAALAASAGAFRFLELRFPNVQQARQRAVLLHLCTFNFEKHAAVPLFVRHQLYNSDAAYGILQLWDLYGLDWPHASKAGIFLLRREVRPSEAVPVNGSKLRSAAEFRADWQSIEEDQHRGAVPDVEKELQRLEKMNKKQKRNADVEEIMAQLSSVSQQELMDSLQSGKLPSGVDSQMVEAWILGNRLTFAGRVIDNKQRTKRSAADKMAMRSLLTSAKEQDRQALLNRRLLGPASQAPEREWEIRLMSFYASANAERVAEEARSLLEGRRAPGYAQGQSPAVQIERPSESGQWHQERWLVSETKEWKEEREEEKDRREEKEEQEKEVQEEEEEQEEEAFSERTRPWIDGENDGRPPPTEEVAWTSAPPPDEAMERPWRTQAKARRAREELRQMAATFCTRRCFIQRLNHTADVRAVKADREDQNRARVTDVKTSWAARTQVMAVRHHDLLNYHRRGVDDLRRQMEDLSQLRSQRHEEELQRKRAAIVEQKVLKRPVGTRGPGGQAPRVSCEDFGKAFDQSFSGTESTRATLGATEALCLTDRTWASGEKARAARQAMAATMQSLRTAEAEVKSARLPMAATDSNWHPEEKRTKNAEVAEVNEVWPRLPSLRVPAFARPPLELRARGEPWLKRFGAFSART